MRKKLFFLISICYIIIIGTAFFRPLIIKMIMDKGLIYQDFQYILLFACLLLLVSTLEQVVCVFQIRLFENLKKQFVLNIYSKIFKKLLNLKVDYFQKSNSTEIINKLSTDISSISIMVDSSMMNLMNYVLQIISGVIGLFVISWKLALLVMLIAPIKYIMISFFSNKKEIAIKEFLEESTQFSAWFSDNVQGIKEIKLWNLYKLKHAELRKRQKKVLDLEKRRNLLEAYNAFSDSSLQWIVVSGLYALGGYWVCNNSLTLGALTAFISYSNYVIGPISLLFNLKLIFAQIKPSINRLHEFYNLEVEEPAKKSHCKIEFRDKIQFENIDFSYSKQRVLSDVCLSIRKGEKIAIVGENGSGKTTLINILLRFLKPGAGNIFIDGINIEDYDLNSYREMFSVVSQEVYLFKDSIHNNITMNRRGDEKELFDLCNEMHIDKVIQKLMYGYNSILDNNGENLSGGERQKIALLRAIFKDSPILIMDEATANIDKEYDEFVHQYIMNDCKDKTIILITHKLDNLKGMDKIYKIHNATIEKCKYHDLL